MEESIGPSAGASQQPRSDRGEGLRAGREVLLRRSKSDRVLFGVCGGLGRYLGVDPVVVRLLFVLLAVLGGGGVILYLVALVVIPEERPGEPVVAAAQRSSQTVVLVIGGALVLAGAFMLANRLVPWMGALAGPLVLMAIGVLVIMAARR